MAQEAILILEKNPSDKQLLSTVVTKLGYPNLTVADLKEAIACLKNDTYPVVISNIACEAPDGTGILAYVRNMEAKPPFVIMTGFGGEYSFDRVFGSGAQEFIKKPFTADQLDNRLKRIFHERKLAKENQQLQQKQIELNDQLKILLSVATDLTSELDADRLFPLIIGKISEAMSAERTSLYVIDWENEELWTRVSEGIEPLRLKIGVGISGRVAKTGEVVCVQDAWDLPYFNREYDQAHTFRTRSVLCLPIYNRMGERFAVIQVINKRGRPGFEENDIEFLNGLGSQVGIALENALLYDEIRLSFESFIRTLSAVVDARHPLTAGHSQRVTEYSLMIADQMKLSSAQKEVLKIAALLHDIGKIGIRDDVLLKNGPFTPEERAEMNTHPTKTKQILDEFRFPRALRRVPDIAWCHHERVNGQGYPQGLTGDEMTLESKIMAVADVFDALTSCRDYPKYTDKEIFNCDPMPLDKAISIIQSDAGSHFDDAVVGAFMACLPKILLRFRGGHFPLEYVDNAICRMAPDLLAQRS